MTIVPPIPPFFLSHADPQWGPASLVIIVLALTSPLSVLIVAKRSTDLDLTRAFLGEHPRHSGTIGNISVE
jgi:hypothetical protein